MFRPCTHYLVLISIGKVIVQNFYFIFCSLRGEHECSLMRVEAADVASALDKLSYEKVGLYWIVLFWFWWVFWYNIVILWWVVLRKGGWLCILLNPLLIEEYHKNISFNYSSRSPQWILFVVVVVVLVIRVLLGCIKTLLYVNEPSVFGFKFNKKKSPLHRKLIFH